VRRLEALGLTPSNLPRGFTWSTTEGCWTRTVPVDPSGESGMCRGDADQLGLFVAAFNSQHGEQVLQVRFTDPE